MMKCGVSMVMVVWLATTAWAVDAPRTESEAPKTHTSACSLAESMASKLGYRNRVTHEVAQKTCTALAPTMQPADHAEFLRCCMKQLEGAPSASGAAPKSKQDVKKPAKASPTI